MTDEQLHWIAAQGKQVFVKQGDIFIKQGESAEGFYFLLAGELEFTTNDFGNQNVHVINLKPGSFFGPELFLLNIPTFLGTGHAIRNSHLFHLEENVFWDVLAECPSIIREVLRAAARLWQNYEEVLLHHGKLNAIDTLSAGLAHELNNPAASIIRSAADLEKTLLTLPSFLLKLYQLPLTQNQLAFIVDLPCNLIAQQKMSARLDPLLQSDREHEVLYWLEKHGILNGWQLAPTLVKAGINTQWLDTVTKEIFPSPPGEILTWLEAMLTGFDLSSEIKQGSARISELVSNVKKYSHVGLAPLQEINVHEELENTLKILQYKLKQKPGVIINREYDKNLPRIYAYGSELNQVWTNLIDNAIDAIDEKGNLWVRTIKENNRIVVEIADDGLGIPPKIQARIFEPFFTTKDIGKGTGIGLDIVRRIVIGQHKGDIRVFSEPGNTRFQVCLPICTV
ncbi:MAG: ATP-binding protein [Pleurocapsa sp. MO_192.B19]|nr:ATP-binding protein [Pleurocapsa sp. MO_192.B19]